MQMQNPRGNQDMPPPMPWAPPQGFPMNAGSGPGFMPNHQYMPPPPHQFDNYYPPADIPPLDKQPRQPPPSYGRDASMGAHTPSMQPQPSIVTKVFVHLPHCFNLYFISWIFIFQYHILS